MNQIKNRSEIKREFDYREKLYYKPHFGPEETDSLIEAENDRRDHQKAYVNQNLQMQMNFEQTRKQD